MQGSGWGIVARCPWREMWTRGVLQSTIRGCRSPVVRLSSVIPSARVAPYGLFSRRTAAVIPGAIVVATLLGEPRSVEAAASFPETFSEVFEAFSKLDVSLKRRLVRSSIVYPKTKSLGDEPAVAEATFDGTLGSFRAACNVINEEVELKARGTDVVVKELLDTLAQNEDFFRDIGGEAVDAIVLHRFSGHVVRIQRTPVRSGKHDGRVLFIELNDVRQNAINAFTTTKSAAFDYVVAGVVTSAVVLGSWLVVGGATGAAVIALAKWYSSSPKKSDS